MRGPLWRRTAGSGSGGRAGRMAPALNYNPPVASERQILVGSVPVGGVLGLVFNVIWKGFDMFIGAIQAFIFALLTVLYFAMAGAGHGDDHADDQGDEHDSDEVEASQETPALAS